MHPYIIEPYISWKPIEKKKSWQEELFEQQKIAEFEARILYEQYRNQINNNNAVTTGGSGVPPVVYLQRKIEHTSEVDKQMNLDEVPSFPKFFLPGVTLKKVVLSSDIYPIISHKVENKQFVTHSLDVKLTSAISYTTAVNGTFLMMVSSSRPFQAVLAPYDGVVDWSGSSGYTFPLTVQSASKTVEFTDPAILQEFSDVSTGGTIELYFTTSLQASGSYPSNASIRTSGRCRAVTSLRYEFDF